MKNGLLKINKRQWYNLGGFKNSRLFRRGTKRGWTYYADLR